MPLISSEDPWKFATHSGLCLKLHETDFYQFRSKYSGILVDKLLLLLFCCCCFVLYYILNEALGLQRPEGGRNNFYNLKTVLVITLSHYFGFISLNHTETKSPVGWFLVQDRCKHCSLGSGLLCRSHKENLCVYQVNLPTLLHSSSLVNMSLNFHLPGS